MLNTCISINSITLGKLLKRYEIISVVKQKIKKAAKKYVQFSVVWIDLLEKLILKIQILKNNKWWNIYLYYLKIFTG